MDNCLLGVDAMIATLICWMLFNVVVVALRLSVSCTKQKPGTIAMIQPPRPITATIILFPRPAPRTTIQIVEDSQLIVGFPVIRSMVLDEPCRELFFDADQR